MGRQLAVGLNAVILAVTSDEPRVLVLPPSDPALREDSGRGAVDGIPFGPLDPDQHRTLELGLRRWVRELTGLELGYVEQLYTFGDRDREAGRLERRVLSIGYLALAREGSGGDGGAHWRDVYDSFPWEDWRRGRPRLLREEIPPALDSWVQAAPDAGELRSRRERADITFGLRGAPWDGDRVLERYELLYEANLVTEARRDRASRARLRGGEEPPAPPPVAERLGRPMLLDHRRILATALGRIRGKLKYRPVVFELLPETFTLLQLQRVVEALAGLPLHKQNFRRLVERGGLVEGTGARDPDTGGRPAELFRFRREVLRERPRSGVRLPGVPR